MAEREPFSSWKMVPVCCNKQEWGWTPSTVMVFLLFFIHKCISKAIDDHDISLLNQKKTRQIRKN